MTSCSRQLTDWTIYHSRLAEAAAPAAAALDFYSSAVVNYFDIRYHRIGYWAVAVCHYLPLNLAFWLRAPLALCWQSAVLIIVHLVQAGHIDTGELCCLSEQSFPVALTGAEYLQKFEYDFFSFTDDEQVDEVGHWLRIKGTAAAGDYQGVRVVPLVAEQRDLSQVEHIQDIGVGKLIAQRKTDDIEVF